MQPLPAHEAHLAGEHLRRAEGHEARGEGAGGHPRPREKGDRRHAGAAQAEEPARLQDRRAAARPRGHLMRLPTVLRSGLLALASLVALPAFAAVDEVAGTW